MAITASSFLAAITAAILLFLSVCGYSGLGLKENRHIVKKYIESLATDTKSKELVATILQLLSRDGTGNLKASRVLQLRKLADKSDNDQFKEGVQIIEEAYQPSLTKQFIRAEWKDEHNKWHIIPLSVTDVEQTETKQETNEDNDNQGTQGGTV